MCTVVTIFSALLFTENSALVISIYTWDGPICQNKGYTLDGHGYIKYLKDIQETSFEIEKECKERGLEIYDLVKITNRPISTLPKLIDEYNWVTITKKCIPLEIIQMIK